MKTKAGLGLVLLGMAVFVAWEAWTKTRKQVPLDIPLTLRAGNTLSEQFRINLNALYLIEIAPEKDLPGERLRCLLGLEPDAAQCKGISPAIEVSWILSRDGRELRRGNSLEPHTLPADTENPVRVIGEFPGQAGQTYQLEMFTNADGQELNRANPHLRVAIASLARTDLQSASVLVSSISFICVFFGAILLGISWLGRGRESSKPAL